MTTEEQLKSFDPEERFYGIMGRFQQRLMAAIKEFQQAVGIKESDPWMDDCRALHILEVAQPDQDNVSFQFPATVWDFFKQAYFPEALLKWFPVRYRKYSTTIPPWQLLTEETVMNWKKFLAGQIKQEQEEESNG